MCSYKSKIKTVITKPHQICSPDFKMALATSSKITGRNLVKSWIPLVAQHRCYNGDNLQERNRKPNSAPNFVKIGLPKWWHETSSDITFRKGFWKYIFPMPFHYGDEDPGGH